jgi:hypothetical protein
MIESEDPQPQVEDKPETPNRAQGDEGRADVTVIHPKTIGEPSGDASYDSRMPAAIEAPPLGGRVSFGCRRLW